MLWLSSLIVTALVTYHYRRLVDNIRGLEKRLEEVINPPASEPTNHPNSFVVDPDDPVSMVKFEQMMKDRLLNK